MTPTDPAIQARHEADLQARERGQLEVIAGLRRSNAALAKDALDTREKLAEAEREILGWQNATGCKEAAEFATDREQGWASSESDMKRIAALEAELKEALADRDDARKRLKTCRECEASNIRELHKADAVIDELRVERNAAQARAGALEVELKAADRSAAIYRNQVAGVRALGALPEETFVEFVRRLHSERDAAQARCAEPETAHAATRRELERWKRWQQIEGDYICENGDIARCPHAVERGLKKERDMSLARCAELERESKQFRRAAADSAEEACVLKDEVRTLRSQLDALTKAPEGDVLADRTYSSDSRSLDGVIALSGRGDAWDARWPNAVVHPIATHLREAIAEGLRLRSQLAEVTAERDRYREALGDCVTAMTLWGSQEDGVPEAGPDFMGSIGAAYDNAKMLLCWADDPTGRKPAPATPQANPLCVPEPEEPRALTVEEAKAAVERGECVESFYPDDPEFVGCIRAIRFGELRVFDPRYPSRGWSKMGTPGHWPGDGALFVTVPDPLQERPEPRALTEEETGGPNCPKCGRHDYALIKSAPALRKGPFAATCNEDGCPLPKLDPSQEQEVRHG